MSKKVVLHESEGSVTLAIPKEMAERLNLNPGTEVYVTEKDNGILITKHALDIHAAKAVYHLPY